MTLWSKLGAEPQALPWSDVDASGNTWTNLADNPEGRAATGWVEAPAQPAYDPTAQMLGWDGSDWVVTPLSAPEMAGQLAAAKSAMLANLASLRWQQQQSMAFMGRVMPADNDTITMCTAAEALARLGGINYETPRNWKIADGIWTVLTTRQIIEYGLAIGGHRQACFDHEMALGQQIAAAANLPALAAVDITSGWPD